MPKALDAAQQILRLLALSGPTAAELETARSRMLSESSQRALQPEAMADWWLDVESYKLASANTEADSFSKLTIADLQRAAGRLFKDASVATVLVGDSGQLKTSLGGSVELRPEKSELKTTSDPVVPTKKP